MSAYDTSAEDSAEPEHATVVKSPARWKGPLIKYDRYGEPTGAEYIRYLPCSVEEVFLE